MRRFTEDAGRVGDIDAMLRAMAAARRIDPELACNYLVGKMLLGAHADPRLAMRYLGRAWRLRPLSMRAAKNWIAVLGLACMQGFTKPSSNPRNLPPGDSSC